MEDSLKEFLISRGISEDTLRTMCDEKVDCSAILAMEKSDAPELSSLFPKFGDRFAIVEFCKLKIQVTKNRKNSLLEKLRGRFEVANKKRQATSNLGLSSDEEVFEKESPNRSHSIPNMIKRPSKSTRIVELGWLCQKGKEPNLIQMRSKQGGGTRKIPVSKDATSSYLLDIAKGLFFPEETSQAGNLSDFNCKMFDFKRNDIPDNITVQEMYEKTGLSVLRFYLATTRKTNSSSATSTVTSGVFENLLEEENLDVTQFHFLDAPASYNYHRDLASSPTVELDIMLPIASSPSTTLVIHRGHEFTELLTALRHYKTDAGPFKVEMILPNGVPEIAVDAGGVLRDCLTQFWTTFCEKHTEGALMKIPVVSEDLLEEHWVSIAKVLVMGWKQENYFPITMAPAFMERCIFQKHSSDLVESFLLTLGSDDRLLLQEGMKNFESVDKKELLQVFSDLNSKSTPVTQDNILLLLHQIAHRELIQKPSYVISCWAPILKNMMSKDTFESIQKTCVASSKNLISALRVSEEWETDQDAMKVFGFLRKFIKESEEPCLRLLTRFCTGADILINRKIEVTFNQSNGYGRRPTAHVCAWTLELPKTYETYVAFKNEMNSLLKSGVWVMDYI